MKEAGVGSSRASKVFAAAWSVAQRHRVVGGVLVGLSLPITRIVSDLVGIPIADTVEVAFLGGLYVVALAALCWPWTSYALALRLSLVSAAALISVGTVSVFVRDSGGTQRIPWIFPIGVFLVFAGILAAAFAVLSAFVFVRMRYWAVFPPGNCQRCGYSLFALQSYRCPECGAPFVPREGSGVGMGQQEPSPGQHALSQRAPCSERLASNPNDRR